MNEHETQGRILSDLRKALRPKMSTIEIDYFMQDIKFTSTKYPGDFSIIDVIFYQQWKVHIHDFKQYFSGDAGGIAGLGFGCGSGYLYTDDIEKLFRETKTFYWFSAEIVYYSIYFLGEKSKLLGHFQAYGGAPSVGGTGGGSGSWK
ncbi:VapA/VapB family virulence-associated protein [Caproicibacter fermentans]|uniref:VapA/VapB family virulence-associated protein n=1 Tax=Caproicibacter fermentans TaxID=2576756 RepID=A0A7G8TDW8_9FIRM|nr:VapA/VapB family virulence-associated protein [Caproicibacter fermentans]QNK41809.1 VapA/VapB family virulence-associated protein [Caproicibacter fermentans]